MPVTYTKIASYTVSAADTDASIVFSSIPQTYTDLTAQMSIRANGSNFCGIVARFNSLTGASDYNYQRIYATGGATIPTDGNTAGGSYLYLAIANRNGLTANSFSPVYFRVYDYTNTSYIKTVLSGAFAGASSGDATRYISMATSSPASNTAAVSTLTFRIDDGSYFRPNSTITLYGIKNS